MRTRKRGFVAPNPGVRFFWASFQVTFHSQTSRPTVRRHDTSWNADYARDRTEQPNHLLCLGVTPAAALDAVQGDVVKVLSGWHQATIEGIVMK